jgi:hypothetical protein
MFCVDLTKERIPAVRTLSSSAQAAPGTWTPAAPNTVATGRLSRSPFTARPRGSGGRGATGSSVRAGPRDTRQGSASGAGSP